MSSSFTIDRILTELPLSAPSCKGQQFEEYTSIGLPISWFQKYIKYFFHDIKFDVDSMCGTLHHLIDASIDYFEIIFKERIKQTFSGYNSLSSIT